MRVSLLLALTVSACSGDAVARKDDADAGCPYVYRAREFDRVRNCLGEGRVIECRTTGASVCSDASTCGVRPSDSALFLFASDCLPSEYRSCTSAEYERVVMAESCESRDAM